MRKILFMLAVLAATTVGAQTVQRYDAKLDGRIPVVIALQEDNWTHVAGYIYYPNAKTPAPIMVVGSAMYYPGEEFYYFLNEYQADGTVTGTILIQRKDGQLKGTWTNPKTQKEMTLTGLTVRNEQPEWFTETLLTPEDPAHIGRYYSYRVWSWRDEDMMGGHIALRGAGKGKVHFECHNVPHNQAEGGSDSDRPAVLDGNMFEYTLGNECGYKFRATFFKRFVIIDTLSDPESLDCFGAGTSFECVYIKTKD